MNNEPVAYLMVDREDGNSYIQTSIPTRDEKVSHHPYPLYTHPAKTDKQILSVVALEERLNWSRLQGSGESYIEGFEDGAEWAEQQVFNPAKTLTDEEIDAIENAVYCKTIQKGKTPHEYIMKFARAILKKASEK